ncbi:MAG: hypothetical protein M1828_003005 [Chrysothrix sp. TS-e1954]|nr:MAG: hypothetical protein M1828_003005 [Chrysothrix sp. TS-e1954]
MQMLLGSMPSLPRTVPRTIPRTFLTHRRSPPSPPSHPHLCPTLRRASSTTPLTTTRNIAMPSNIWDTHTHITDPMRFPLPASTNAKYHPHAALLSSLKSHLQTHEISNVVLVQPSTYGADNRCLLWGLRQLNDASNRDGVGKAARARGVVVIDPRRPPDRDELRDWHALGVRGVRVNLKSVDRAVASEAEAQELRQEIREVLRLVEPFGEMWNLQVYADQATLGHLKPLVSECDGLVGQGTRLVIDHMAGVVREGEMGVLEELVAREGCFVKLSAPYRLVGGSSKDYGELEGTVRRLLGVRGGRGVVWASDWPHTRFEGVVDGEDVRIWRRRLEEWCEGDQELIWRVFGGNAEALYGP